MRNTVFVYLTGCPQNEYASEVAKKLWDAGIFSETDLTGDTLKKKILNAEIARWNFILGKPFCPQPRISSH
jgi:threonyl-tRNA synthetase